LCVGEGKGLVAVVWFVARRGLFHMKKAAVITAAGIFHLCHGQI